MGVKRRQLVLFGGTLLSIGFLQDAILGQNAKQIRSILKSITLRVITPGPSGSAVIVRKSGNSYFFLTAKHVLENASEGEEVYVVTSDGNQHFVDLSSSEKAPSSDLAIASFSSSKNYSVVNLGNSDQMQELDPVFVAGFPLTVAGQPNSIIKISTGPIEQVGRLADGYGLGYNANTQPGMSGGPVLNEDGQLIAIHGRADGERIGGIRVKQGSNWAVPINTAIATFSLSSSAAPVASEAEKRKPKDDYITTESGLKYRDLEEGSGEMPEPRQLVSVHYTGTLPSGKVFDSSLKRGQPFTFPIGAGRVIKGWDEGVATMKVGGKRELVIPPDLAYGDRGIPGAIPPKSTLIFEVQLLDVL